MHVPSVSTLYLYQCIHNVPGTDLKEQYDSIMYNQLINIQKIAKSHNAHTTTSHLQIDSLFPGDRQRPFTFSKARSITSTVRNLLNFPSEITKHWIVIHDHFL